MRNQSGDCGLVVPHAGFDAAWYGDGRWPRRGMAHREVVDKMYAIASDAVQVHRKVLFGGLLFRDPEAILRSAVRILEYLVENLRQLRAVCDNDCNGFESDGFGQFVSMIRSVTVGESPG